MHLAVGLQAKNRVRPHVLESELSIIADVKLTDELIERIANDTASPIQSYAFEEMALANITFRQQVARRKAEYRARGESDKADRLDKALLDMFDNRIFTDGPPEDDSDLAGGAEEGQASNPTGIDFGDYETLFYSVADGEATMVERQDFRDKLLGNSVIYKHVSNLQRMWQSLPSQLPQDRAKRLKRALTLCDTMRAELKRDAELSRRTPTAESASRFGASGGSASGGSASAKGHQSAGGSPKGTSAALSRKRSGGRSGQAPEEDDLIEWVARGEASIQQTMSFVHAFKNDLSFQRQVLQRDWKYLKSKTSEGYKKAATLRLTTGQVGDTGLLHLYPWHPHLVEGFRLAEESLGFDKSEQNDMQDKLLTEIRLGQMTRAAETNAEEERQRRSRRSGQGRANPAGGGSRSRGQGPAGPGSSNRLSPIREGASSTQPQQFPPVAGRLVQTGIPATRAKSQSPDAPPGRLNRTRQDMLSCTSAVFVPREDAFEATGASPIASGTAEPSHPPGPGCRIAAQADAFQAASVYGISAATTQLSQATNPRSRSAAQAADSGPRGALRSDTSTQAGAPASKTRTGDLSQVTTQKSRTTPRSDPSSQHAAASSSRTQGAEASRPTAQGPRTAPREIPSPQSLTATRGAAQANVLQSFIVSESAMNQLHSRLQEARLNEPVRGRTRSRRCLRSGPSSKDSNQGSKSR